MNIVVLLGSPNRQGSSRMLAESFRQGAEETGHTVELIDVAHGNIHPCSGCIYCGYEGPCSQKDDMETIRGKILGCGCGTPSMTKHSPHPQKAYQLGRQLR